MTALLLSICAILVPSAEIKAEATGCECAYLPEDTVISSRILDLFFGSKGSGESKEETDSGLELTVGGEVFGIRIKENCVTVVDKGETDGIENGDKIISIDGESIKEIKDVTRALEEFEGGDISVTVKRGEETKTVELKPERVGDGYKIGLAIRDGAAGIGTITYYDPKTGCFGGLGHGICDKDSSLPIEMTSGLVTGVILGGVQKGAQGKPGELCGVLTKEVLGTLEINSECGVFGTIEESVLGSLDTLPIASKDEVKEGPAKIVSTVKNGRTDEYSVRIYDINHSSDGTKSFKVEVTDNALIALTGGIVRGMSGSPIIQDGKLVGAVTHVMVADPTEGYGIFIENMLNAANNQSQQKAA